MKRKILLLGLSIISIICLSIGISACGTKVETDGILKYSLNDDGGYSVVGIADKTTTEITIPATFNGSSVRIGEYAFSGCSSLETVTIEDGVTSIKYDAFSDCTSLKNIIIGDGVSSIGNAAFKNCTSLVNIVIPDSVTIIDIGAFQNCTSLESVIV